MSVCVFNCVRGSSPNPGLKLISLCLSPSGLSERQQRGLTQLDTHQHTHQHAHIHKHATQHHGATLTQSDAQTKAHKTAAEYMKKSVQVLWLINRNNSTRCPISGEPLMTFACVCVCVCVCVWEREWVREWCSLWIHLLLSPQAQWCMFLWDLHCSSCIPVSIIVIVIINVIIIIIIRDVLIPFFPNRYRFQYLNMWINWYRLPIRHECIKNNSLHTSLLTF